MFRGGQKLTQEIDWPVWAMDPEPMGVVGRVGLVPIVVLAKRRLGGRGRERGRGLEGRKEAVVREAGWRDGAIAGVGRLRRGLHGHRCKVFLEGCGVLSMMLLWVP